MYNLVKGLSSLGHDVLVTTSDNPPVGSYFMNGIAVKRLPVLFRVQGGSPFCPTLPIELLRTNADLVHLHTPPRLFADCASIIHNRPFSSPVPMIVSLHLYLEEPSRATRALSTFHYRMIMPLVLAAASRLVVPTKSYKHLLVERFHISPAKIAVIPYGVDLNMFDPRRFQKEEMRTEFGERSDKIVLFVGRLDVQGAEQKGLKYLLEAIPLVLREIRDVKFLIVGGGERLDYFMHVCKSMGISSHVRFAGHVPSRQMPSLFSIADLLVLPSLHESFGIVLGEAMAMEKPVLATRIRGVVDVVEDGTTGLLVKPRDYGELADATLKILSDEALANRLGKQGRKFVEEHLDWSRIVERTLMIYNSARAQLSHS